MADALRGSMDAAEYKHVVLGLIFLKYISDAFEERRASVLAEFGDDAAEDRDEYTAENIFWVPTRGALGASEARKPEQSTIGLIVDQAQWQRSSATTPCSRTCCRGTTLGPRSTSGGSAS